MDDQHRTIEDILTSTRRIAVVGASPNPLRPSHDIVRVLLEAGFEVVPVTPTAEEVLGLPTVPRLADVGQPIDLVDVFRRPEHLEGVAAEAVEVGARALWLQSGLRSEPARRLAASAGMAYVEDACLGVAVRLHDARPAAP